MRQSLNTIEVLENEFDLPGWSQSFNWVWENESPNLPRASLGYCPCESKKCGSISFTLAIRAL
jgi:hypothetical protein